MTDLIDSINVLVSIVNVFVGVTGALYFLYGAYMYMTSGGSLSRAEGGRQAMVQALIGTSPILGLP